MGKDSKDSLLYMIQNTARLGVGVSSIVGGLFLLRESPAVWHFTATGVGAGLSGIWLMVEGIFGIFKYSEE